MKKIKLIILVKKQSENIKNLRSKFANYQYPVDDTVWEGIHPNIGLNQNAGVFSTIFSDYTFKPSKRVWKNIRAELFPKGQIRFVNFSQLVAASVVILFGMYFLFRNQLVKFPKQNQSNTVIPNKESATVFSAILDNFDNKKTVSSNYNIIKQESKNNKNAISVNVIKSSLVQRKLSNNSIPKTLFMWLKPCNVFYLKTNKENYSIYYPANYLKLLNTDLKSEKSNTKKRKITANFLAVNYSPFTGENPLSGFAKADMESYQATGLADNAYPQQNTEHKSPISLGLSYSVEVSNRLSFSSGANFIMLTDKIIIDNLNSRTENMNSQYFIGIPLLANFKIVQVKRLSLFVNTGMQYEFGLFQKNKIEEYSGEQQTSGYSFTSRLKNGQSSVIFGIGTDYKISNSFDIYFQINSAHYFYLSQNNLWSENSFWLGLQMGIRYNINSVNSVKIN